MTTPAEIMEWRASESTKLYRQLIETAGREDWPAEYRKRRAAELKAAIKTTDQAAERELRRTLQEAAKAPDARIAEGIAWSPAELQEAMAEREANRDRPKVLVGLAADALARGATHRGRVLYKAAQLAGQPTSALDRHILDTDPGLVQARSELRSLERTALAMSGDMAREQATYLATGEAWAKASIHAKTVARQLGLDPDTATTGESFAARLTRLPAPDGRLEQGHAAPEPPPAVVPAA